MNVLRAGPRERIAFGDTVAFYDIFNGDADGICALHQLRMTEPREAELVTGTKREIRLVERCAAASGAQARRRYCISLTEDEAPTAVGPTPVGTGGTLFQV